MKLLEKLYSAKIFRFILVGGISTVFDFTVYMTLSLKISPDISKLISMCCSCTFSFFCNRYWTFKDSNQIDFLQISKYIIVQIINISVNVASNSLLFSVIHINKLISFCAATCTAMGVNYFLQKKIVFKSKDKEQ